MVKRAGEMSLHELGKALGVLFTSYAHDCSALAVEVTKLFEPSPEDELAQVRADITRTAMVVVAQSAVRTPGHTIGDYVEHERQARRLDGLLRRELVLTGVEE